MATGESGDGPANDGLRSGYLKFRPLLLLATATMAAAVLLLVAMAAAVIPLNFAATACSADHISLFSVLFLHVNSNFGKQQILTEIFSSIHRSASSSILELISLQAAENHFKDPPGPPTTQQADGDQLPTTIAVRI